MFAHDINARARMRRKLRSAFGKKKKIKSHSSHKHMRNQRFRGFAGKRSGPHFSVSSVSPRRNNRSYLFLPSCESRTRTKYESSSNKCKCRKKDQLRYNYHTELLLAEQIYRNVARNEVYRDKELTRLIKMNREMMRTLKYKEGKNYATN